MKPDTVTHPNTNRAQRRVTSLILPTSLPTTRIYSHINHPAYKPTPFLAAENLAIISDPRISQEQNHRQIFTLDCQPVSDSRPRRLRSSDSLTCVVRYAHNTYGNRCFATAGPRVWNSLPAELQSCDSLRQFKRCLKTFLFGSWDYSAL